MHDEDKYAFYKLIKNAPYGQTIENIAHLTDIELLNKMENEWKFAKKRTEYNFGF